jgi:hypothetical protein
MGKRGIFVTEMIEIRKTLLVTANKKSRLVTLT